MLASKRISITLAATLLLTNPAAAATTPGGWLPVRVLDGVKATHCIDRTKESVSIRLTRIVVDRQAVWFAEDKKVDVLLNVILAGRTSAGRQVVVLPRAYGSTFKSAPAGLLSVDSEFAPVTGYKLADGGKVSVIRVELFLGNESGSATLADVLLGIADATDAMPLPANALARVSESIGANIVGRLGADSALADSFAKQVVLRFAFSPTGQSDPGNASACQGAYESTGTRAMIKEAKGSEADGIVDIGKFYCYRVVAAPSYKLQFAAPKPDGTCTVSSATWNDVHNPFISYYLNADAPAAVSRPRAIAPSDESLARCRANGVSKKLCNRRT